MNEADEPVVVVATIKPLEGKADEVEAALRAAVREVHAEPGCRRYALHRATAGGAFVLIEQWASAQALDTHSKQPALAELRRRLDGLLAERLDVVVLDALPEGDPELGAL